jgi:TPR repeat protein
MRNTAGLARGRLHRRVRGDRGSATGWALGTMFVGLLLAGLVFDGGAAMTTKASALSVAQQAARAGADQLDLATLRATGEVHLDPAAAEQAAASWLAQAAQTGTVAATTEQVTVTVTATGSAVLLSVVGITSYELSATATAEAVQP